MELLMEVFDKDFVRIGAFNNYSSVMYNRTLSASSNYTMKLPFIRSNIELLMHGEYLLIDETFLAEMKYIKKNIGETVEVESKGYNIKNMLVERCVYPMQEFSGTPPQVMRKMVLNNAINPNDKRRVIKELKLMDSYPSMSETFDMQQTGNDVYSELVKIAGEYEIGFEIIPRIVEYENNRTNIDSLYFNVFKGEDRTVGNKSGNVPVVFSMELNNVESTSYIRDHMDYRNVAYVAGEGQGVSEDPDEGRIVIEVGNKDLTGRARKEVYIDARDCQKERNDGSVISDAVYLKMLTKRGNEKLQEYRMYETYEGTVISNEDTYVYGRDFKEGDKVTIRDEELGLDYDTVLTEVKITHDRSGEHIDVVFGYDSV